MTLGTFSVCVFAWHGLESCCCSGVSQPASKGLAPIVLGVLEGASSNGLVFSLMDSKGDVRHFFGVRFAWHGLESCCCSGVSEPASKGLAPIVLGVLEGASSNGLVFSLMDSKEVTLGTFSVCVLLGVGSNPAAVWVFRNRPVSSGFLGGPEVAHPLEARLSPWAWGLLVVLGTLRLFG